MLWSFEVTGRVDVDGRSDSRCVSAVCKQPHSSIGESEAYVRLSARKRQSEREQLLESLSIIELASLCSRHGQL